MLNRVCPVCGATFETNQKARRVYCSAACKQSARIDRETERIAAHRLAQKAAMVRDCPVCGRRFTPDRLDVKHCSHACKQKAYRVRRAKKA